jgi:hypothetical protein
MMTMVDGKVLYGDPALSAGAPCETLDVCGHAKALCVAEPGAADKLDQTYAQIVGALTQGLATYDSSVAGMGIAPFSPLAPLTHCP